MATPNRVGVRSGTPAKRREMCRDADVRYFLFLSFDGDPYHFVGAYPGVDGATDAVCDSEARGRPDCYWWLLTDKLTGRAIDVPWLKNSEKPS